MFLKYCNWSFLIQNYVSLDECQEEHLERIYQYDSTRQIQVREYFFQRSAFDKK